MPTTPPFLRLVPITVENVQARDTGPSRRHAGVVHTLTVLRRRTADRATRFVARRRQRTRRIGAAVSELVADLVLAFVK